jgi:hypothetical protein
MRRAATEEKKKKALNAHLMTNLWIVEALSMVQ